MLAALRSHATAGSRSRYTVIVAILKVLRLPASMQLLMTAGLLAAAAIPALACDACQPSANDVVLTRNVRRMQPDAQSAHVQPKGPLEWGQVNFLHTTDTHGWLEGHLKEQNYGADWGDFSSFAKDMQNKARLYGRDLLLIDTGTDRVGDEYEWMPRPWTRADILHQATFMMETAFLMLPLPTELSRTPSSRMSHMTC